MMKKYYFLLLLGGFWHPATAQHQEKEAFSLLDSIIQRDFQATFTYSSRSSQAQQEEISEGNITVQGNQYRLTMQQQEIVNNGQTIWTYLIEANEVQITDHDPEQEATTPWEALANYRQDYTLDRLDTHQVDGQVYDVVALVATNDAYNVEKIILTVAHTTRHIKRLEILDSSQVLHTFSMTNFTYNLALYKAFFNFNLDDYQDIEIIDMR
jgi:outer membrane lipoprotein-sorting protein